MKIIKKYSLFFSGCLVVFMLSAGLIVAQQKKIKPSKEKLLQELVVRYIEDYHFAPKPFDDDFSKALWKNFIDETDYSHNILLEDDIKSFEKYKTLLDDELQEYDLSFFNEVVSACIKRSDFVAENIGAVLEKPFDFKEKETWIMDDTSYAKSEKELLERWRKYLKYSILSRLYNDMEAEEASAKKDSSHVKKSFADLEKGARERVKKNYTDYFKRLKDTKRDDYLASYLNCIAMYQDPHTNYMAPRQEKSFNVSVSGQLEGIGAQLSNKDGYITVSMIVPGSPSWKEGSLKVADQILDVAQSGEDFVSIVGMPLDDAVDLIRGKKGTKVRLRVKSPDGTMKEINLVRDVVEFEETFVRSSVVEKNGKKYGFILLPKFYVNLENRYGRESSADFRQEIEKLKAENVAGIIIDLRNNTGGSLQSAVNIGGLFIDKGPIVQTRYRGQLARSLNDTKAGAQWEGPLVVLQNELSASASEILAAALKDYRRAVIVGTETSFGKGSVQNVNEFDEVFPYTPSDDRALGALKLTIEKFYRINGASTQLKGVPSDVVLPDVYSALDVSEKAEKNALEWDSIRPAVYKTIESPRLEQASRNSRERIAQNEYFRLVNKNIEWLKARQDEKAVPLSYDEFAADMKKYTQESKQFEKDLEYKSSVVFGSPSYEKQQMENDTVFAARRKQWHKDLNKDAAAEEAVNILEELGR